MERLIDDNENELVGFAEDKKRLSSIDEFADDDGEVDDVEDDEFENEDKIVLFDVEKHAQMVVTILKPVSFTMALVVWMVRLIHVITVNVK